MSEQSYDDERAELGLLSPAERKESYVQMAKGYRIRERINQALAEFCEREIGRSVPADNYVIAQYWAEAGRECAEAEYYKLADYCQRKADELTSGQT